MNLLFVKSCRCIPWAAGIKTRHDARRSRAATRYLRQLMLHATHPAKLTAFVMATLLPGTTALAQATQPAAQPAAAVAAAPPPTPEQTVGNVLTARCSGCHQPGWLWGGMTTIFAEPLDLAALLRDPAAVQPGRPDASRLYTVMLSGHAQASPAGAAPTAAEIDAVRAWIAGAEPAPAAQCTRRQVTLADIGHALERLKQPGAAALKGIRFISLARQHNGCASDAELAATRTAVRDLLVRLRRGATTIELPLAADDLPVLAVRLTDLGWPATRWDALAAVAAAPEFAEASLAEAYGTATPLIDAAALASAASTLGHSVVLADRDSDAPPLPGALLHSDALRDLAIAGRVDIDLQAASSDLGLPPQVLYERLSQLSGDQEGAARALRQGSISRSAWHALRAHVTMPGGPGPLRYGPGGQRAAASERLEVHLWSDKPAYSKGDLVVLTAQPNRDCHLNVINIDTRGEATVLFPSDSDPDNAVKAGTKVRVPSTIEPYQLRASERGLETFVAVCAVNRKRMLGVDQDFEKQRFSILGDWREFLLTRETREQLVGRRDTPRQRRARAKADAAAAAATKAPEREARSAIYVRIE